MFSCCCLLTKALTNSKLRLCIPTNSISILFQWEEQVLNPAHVNLCHFSKVIHVSRALFSPVSTGLLMYLL